MENACIDVEIKSLKSTPCILAFHKHFLAPTSL